jgi:hypothetical protein
MTKKVSIEDEGLHDADDIYKATNDFWFVGETHEFVGQYGLGNKFCGFPVGSDQCLKPRDALVHKTVSKFQELNSWLEKIERK